MADPRFHVPCAEDTMRRLAERHHCRQRDFAANDLRWQDDSPEAYFARLRSETARQREG